jgi:hypothetical protein
VWCGWTSIVSDWPLSVNVTGTVGGFMTALPS